MTDPNTIGAALAAGLVTSAHCAGMCGPLACTLSKSDPHRFGHAFYHIGRLTSYGLIGALCGFLGQQPLRWFFDSPAVLLPWILVALFLLVALGLWKKIPQPRILQRLIGPLRLRTLRLTSQRGGFLMGLFTPLLPCAPLYLLFGTCLLTGSALRGAEFALAFGIGTIPLLWLVQRTFGRLQSVIPTARLAHLQRIVALLTAVVLIWRLQDTLPRKSPPPPTATQSSAPALPSCCH